MRWRSVLGVVALVSPGSGCGGALDGGARERALVSPLLPEDPQCVPRPVDADNGKMNSEISLERASEQVLRAVTDRVVRGRLITVAVHRHDGCRSVVEVLRCTRPIPWTANQRTEPFTPFGDPRALRLSRWEERQPYALDFGQMRALRSSWTTELFRSGYRDPDVGEHPSLIEPPVDTSELAGPDCARATHVAMHVIVGTVRAVSPADRRVLYETRCVPGAPCEEPLKLEYLRRVTHRGCPTLTTRTPRGCEWLRRPVRFSRPPPVWNAPCDESGGGRSQQGPELQRAHALLEQGGYAEAAAIFERVGAGELRESPDIVQLAQWQFAMASVDAGDMAGAVGALEVMAQDVCHGAMRRARGYLALAHRRATVPPIE